MKQQTSILQWASLMLQQDVKSLMAIQDVKFLKNLLWKIDSSHFSSWQSGRGSQNFTQVIQVIGKYFKNQIGTDIKQHIQGLNAYKNPRDLWELLLGIAIKGNNRGSNISLILDMDHATQAELVGIVSGIIDKFGQNATQSKLDYIQQEVIQNQENTNEREMLMNIIKDNEQMNERLILVETDLQKQKLEVLALINQKKQLQNQIRQFKLEKSAFLEALASANRSDSRIFDDGDETILHAANLSELGNDIIIFVRDLRKRLNAEEQRNSMLEQALQMTKMQANRAAQQNQSYLLQLGNLNAYQNQIDQLRQEINEVFNQNSILIDRINELQQEKQKLFYTFQRKAKQQQQPLQEQRLASNNQQQNITVRKYSHSRRQGQKNFNSSNSSDSHNQPMNGSLNNKSDGSQIQKHPIQDELKEPKLRTKLQRQIEYLKNTNQLLKRNNSALKINNYSLQQSAKMFMQNTQVIANQWQSDFLEIMDKINELTNQNKKKQSSLYHQSEYIQPVIKIMPIPQSNENQEHTPFEPQVQTESRIYQGDEEKNNQVDNSHYQQNAVIYATAEEAVREPMRQEVDANQQIWRQVRDKISNIVTNFKQKELAYENMIHNLRAENLQLIESRNRNFNQIKQSDEGSLSIPHLVNLQSKPEEQINNDVFYDGEVESSSKKMTHLSYLSIKEGQDIDEVMVKRRTEGQSVFYNAGSKIVNQINIQHPQLYHQTDSLSDQKNGLEEQSKLLFLNRKLFSASKANLFELKNKFETEQQDDSSKQLQERLQQEIVNVQAHYRALNQNYQEVFNKLNIFNDKWRQKQMAQLQGIKLLQHIQSVETDIFTNQESELIKVRNINSYLRTSLSEAVLQKQELLSWIQQISKAINQTKNNKNQNLYQQNFINLISTLQRLKINFTETMSQPLSFLNSRLEANFQEDKQGIAQTFYRMYIKQKKKSQQIALQLTLLTNVLLQYRNIIEF